MARGVEADIRAIGDLIASAGMLLAVREEVAKVRSGFTVTDGRHQQGAEGYEVVVRCSAESQTEVARRIRSGVPNVRVDGLADGVLGVRAARRGRAIHGI